MPLLDTLASIVAPHYCLGCQREGKIFCDWCSHDLLPLPSRCYRCHELTNNFVVCQRCRNYTALRQVWIRTAYESVSKELMHGFKYEHKYAAAKAVARAITDVLPAFDNKTLLVAVPTATTRQRERGYDHTRLIVKEIARMRKLFYLQPLARINQSTQVGATRQQRFQQLQNAFLLTRPEMVNNKHIVLIDDIVTTGATLEALAKILKNAGATRVDGAVFAQKR